MYNLQLNNYHLNPKNSTIYTPSVVSEFLFNLLKDKFPTQSLILDPGCGGYSLLKPWQQANYQTIGIDNDLTSQANYYEDFLKLKQWIYHQPSLILCNPPFNGYGNKLGSEVWLQKILALFGKDIPLVLFTPMGFRLNGKQIGHRWKRFSNNFYPLISSIISLPRDIFPNIEFHSEILIFNIPSLEPHYFFTSKNHE